MYIVEIVYGYSELNELYFYDTLKEANSFLVDDGFIYDSSDEEFDYWVADQFTTATVSFKN